MIVFSKRRTPMLPGTHITIGMQVKAYCPDKGYTQAVDYSTPRPSLRQRLALYIGQQLVRIGKRMIATHPTPVRLSEKPA
jgi:hypothetical protein